MYLAFGVAALVVAFVLAAVLWRLRGTLGAMQELIETSNDEMRSTLPEVRETIANVNQITAGVNVGLRTAGRGMLTLGDRVNVAAHGVKMGFESLWRSYAPRRGGAQSGK